jgi:hypothetical protein
MLYRFQSHATPDLLMLESVGRQVLKLWGKASGQPGILCAADMPQAIAQLHAAVAAEEAEAQRRQQAQQQAAAATLPDAAPHSPPDNPEAEADEAHASLWATPVPLRARVVPLLDVLQRCMAEGADLVWGV